MQPLAHYSQDWRCPQGIARPEETILFSREAGGWGGREGGRKERTQDREGEGFRYTEKCEDSLPNWSPTPSYTNSQEKKRMPSQIE